MRRLALAFLSILLGICAVLPLWATSFDLGLDTQGASSTGSASGGLILASGPWVASGSGTAINVQALCGGATQDMTLGIYADDGTYSGGNTGNPGALLGQGAGGNLCGGSPSTFQSQSVSVAITSGNVYWIAWTYVSGGQEFWYNSVSGRGRLALNTYSSGNMPDPFPASPSVFGVDLSLFAEVMSGGGSSTSNGLLLQMSTP